jgi:putative transposase
MTDLATKAAELMEKATPIILTYRYRVKDRSARKALRQYAVAVNQVWNYCNAFQRDLEARYRLGAPKRRWPSAFGFHRLTSGTSTELGIPSTTINQVCTSYGWARDKARRSVSFRASFGPRRALGWVPIKKGTVRVGGNSLTYYGRQFRWFGAKRRPLPESIRNMAFVEDARGRWYICFEVDAEIKPTGTQPPVGIDLGIKLFAATNDGRKIEAPRIYREYERRLGIAQRAGNKQRVRRLHAKIANCRRDFLHKASTDLARTHALIAVGNVSFIEIGPHQDGEVYLGCGLVSL